MSTYYLYDAAYAPDLDKVKENGGIAMSVYLTGGYATTCAQPDALHAKGLGVLGNYEEAIDELLYCGRAGGVDIGRRAAEAYLAKGAPGSTGLGIAFSVDVSADPSTFGAIGEAFVGIREGLAGRFVPKVYGEGALIDYLVAHHEVEGLQWLSASTSFPGFNPADPHVGRVQLVGTPVPGTDQDTITNFKGLGIWWPVGSPHAHDNATPLEDDMTPEQAKQLADLHDRLGKIDTMNYAIHNQVAPAVADMRPKVQVLYARDQGGQLDPKELALDLAAALGPDLATQLAAELGTIVTHGAAPA
ncbi:MAG: hypothetical protein DLM57_04615 [Pseudonocardiales bacterium]|nr:MAG: hypothetical protein DLM57_04615 [Pseudonocardiales bacterium]